MDTGFNPMVVLGCLFLDPLFDSDPKKLICRECSKTRIRVFKSLKLKIQPQIKDSCDPLPSVDENSASLVDI